MTGEWSLKVSLEGWIYEKYNTKKKKKKTWHGGISQFLSILRTHIFFQGEGIAIAATVRPYIS